MIRSLSGSTYLNLDARIDSSHDQPEPAVLLLNPTPEVDISNRHQYFKTAVGANFVALELLRG
jgi:hypothetical protein